MTSKVPPHGRYGGPPLIFSSPVAQSVYIGKAFASTVIVRHHDKKRFAPNGRAMPRRRLPALRTCFSEDSFVLGTTLKRAHGMTRKQLLPDIQQGRKERKLDVTRKSHKSWGSAHKLPDSASPQNTTDRSTARTSTFKYRAGSADGVDQQWQMDKPRPKRLSLSSAAVCSANEALKRRLTEARGTLTDRHSTYARGKTILPSKEGYHPRSLSATFKRLTKVKERLESEVLQSDDSNKEENRRHFEYETKKENTTIFHDPSPALVCTCNRSSSNLRTSNGHVMWRIPYHMSESNDETWTRRAGQYGGDLGRSAVRRARQFSRDQQPISEHGGPVLQVVTSVLSEPPRNTEYKNGFSKLAVPEKTTGTTNTENGDQRKWQLHVTLPSVDFDVDGDWVDER